MQTNDEFTQYYSELLEGDYDCVDRIVINAYYPMGQTPGGFRTWWRDLDGSDARLDAAHLMRVAGRFSRRVRAWAKHNSVPVINCAPGERKHEIAHEHLPSDPNFVGVFLVLVSKSKAPVWQVRRFGKGGLDLRKTLQFVNHYFFHIMDPQWGHVTIKMSGHPPFGSQIILNGHEWVEREAKRQGIALEKEDNCFTGCSDPSALDKVADSLASDNAIGRLYDVCDRWIYSACLCFGLPLDEQERSRFRYSYSVFQLEYSRNLRFERGSDMDQVYQALIDRTRNELDVKRLTKLFGSKYRPHISKKDKRPPIQAKIEKPTYDLTVFKLHFGKLSLKIYDKGERTLRIEGVAHNIKDLKCGKDLSHLCDMISSLKEMVVRFLNVISSIDISFIDNGALDELHQPSCVGERRVAGVDINQSRIRSVLAAVIVLGPKPGGFSTVDLAAKVREITGCSDSQYTTRQASYDLLKLRYKQIIERVGKSRRYIALATGIRIVCALLTLREKVIKPLVAAAGKLHRGPKPKNYGAIDAHYENLFNEMRRTFATLGIAA
jgi:hypothetical protein